MSLASWTVKVRVVEPVIPLKENASCFVLSVVFRTLKPPSFVTTAVDVTDDNPAIVVNELPRETALEPIVIELLASWPLGMALVPNSPVLLL